MSDVSRQELREHVAKGINALSRPELLKAFAISRVAELTNLDNIGLPVYSCVRGLSKTISIHSGKGLDRAMTRAGAILEAIEFEVAEHPVGPFKLAPAAGIPKEERLALEDCLPARSTIVNDSTPLPWEEMTNIQTGKTRLVPSDLVWMANRISDQRFMHFQMGSNGLASGGSLEDAILSGLYEIIERDAWTLNQFIQDNVGVMPKRTPLTYLSDRMESCVRKIEAADSKLHLFDITTDYRVPVFSAVILDLSGHCAGTFGGYGCHLSAEVAALRAITEAAQARCLYISGARDDMFRRQFLLMKRMDQARLDQMFNALDAGSQMADYRSISFPDVRSELRYVLKLVRQFGISEVYVKEFGALLDGLVQVVRVFSPQCEGVRWDHWAPSLRCISYAQRRVMELSKKQAKLPVEEGEEWKDA